MKIYVQESFYFLFIWTRHDIFNTNVHKHRKKKQMDTFYDFINNLIFERSVIVVESISAFHVITGAVQCVCIFFIKESFKALNCFHPINIHLHKIWKICVNIFIENWTKCNGLTVRWKTITIICTPEIFSKLKPGQIKKKFFIASTIKFCLYHHLQFLPIFPDVF